MSDAPGTAGGRVWLVGTAHISPDSVAEVERAITDVQPDVVAVELDEGRYRRLRGDTPDDIDPKTLLHGDTGFQFLAYWLLSYIQMRLGERFKIKPGADMKAAIDTAEANNIPIALVDREIHTTLQRFWARMSIREKLRLVWHLALGSLGYGTTDTTIDLDTITDQDVVRALVEELRRFSPGGAEALIDERDAYIAHHIHALAADRKDVVAVVGAGHVHGIQGYLDTPTSLPPIDTLEGTTKRRWFSPLKVFGYLVMLAFFTFFFLLFMAGVQNTFLLKLFLSWFLFNGIFAFSFAKLAGARWSSASVGGLVAWLTSINPLLAPGWFAGYVELRHSHVNVTDIDRLNTILSDEESPLRDLLAQLLDVPMFRIIAVVAMTNVGSFTASVLFPFVVIPWLAPEIGGVSAIGDALVSGAENSAVLILETLGLR